jgi:hypothetical protein
MHATSHGRSCVGTCGLLRCSTWLQYPPPDFESPSRSGFACPPVPPQCKGDLHIPRPHLELSTVRGRDLPRAVWKSEGLAMAEKIPVHRPCHLDRRSHRLGGWPRVGYRRRPGVTSRVAARRARRPRFSCAERSTLRVGGFVCTGAWRKDAPPTSCSLAGGSPSSWTGASGTAVLTTVGRRLGPDRTLTCGRRRCAATWNVTAGPQHWRSRWDGRSLGSGSARCAGTLRRSLVVSCNERVHDHCHRPVVGSLTTHQQLRTAHRVDPRGCALPKGGPCHE